MILGRSNRVVQASRRTSVVRHHHPANRSRIILPPRTITEVAQSLAATEPQDLGRLKAVLEEAQRTDASADEVANTLQAEVPSASFLAPLLKDGAAPLAQWLTLLLTILMLVMAYREQQPEPTITPEQVEEIITRVMDEQKVEPATEPPTAPEEQPPRPRSGR